MIKIGDAIPSMKLTAATPDGPKEASTEEVFGTGKVVLFAVPGAFTPTCSMRHLPGYLENMDTLRARGVDRVACVAVNDPFVMQAWAKDQGVDGRITMLADGSGAFTRALGLELDLTWSRTAGWRIWASSRPAASTSARRKAYWPTCNPQAAARSRSVSVWKVSVM